MLLGRAKPFGRASVTYPIPAAELTKAVQWQTLSSYPLIELGSMSELVESPLHYTSSTHIASGRHKIQDFYSSSSPCPDFKAWLYFFASEWMGIPLSSTSTFPQQRVNRKSKRAAIYDYPMSRLNGLKEAFLFLIRRKGNIGSRFSQPGVTRASSLQSGKDHSDSINFYIFQKPYRSDSLYNSDMRQFVSMVTKQTLIEKKRKDTAVNSSCSCLVPGSCIYFYFSFFRFWGFFQFLSKNGWRLPK